MTRYRCVVVLILAVAIGGCAGPKEAVLGEGDKAAGPRTPEYAVVRVLFATDRNPTGSSGPEKRFGGLRSETMTYGTCDVSMPRNHKLGELEAPSIWRLEFRKDPEKHVVLLRVGTLSADQFFPTLAKRIEGSEGRNALVFVHGFNVTFDEAAMRTAQIAYDLGFAGAPVFYSWPSQGSASPVAYIEDGNVVDWAELHLSSFLRDFLTRTSAQSVYLIAHSMGSRVLTKAVARLHASDPVLVSRLKEIVLAAPDIDSQVFRTQIAPALALAARPVTLYASSRDLALTISKKLNGYPRAGDSGDGLVLVSGVETIDATTVDTSLTGHSRFESRSVLSDLFYLIREGKRADQRFGLERVDSASGRYWVFK